MENSNKIEYLPVAPERWDDLMKLFGANGATCARMGTALR